MNAAPTLTGPVGRDRRARRHGPGTGVIARFVRPAAWQGLFDRLPPDALRGAPSYDAPRSVDGRFFTGSEG